MNEKCKKKKEFSEHRSKVTKAKKKRNSKVEGEKKMIGRRRTKGLNQTHYLYASLMSRQAMES